MQSGQTTASCPTGIRRRWCERCYPCSLTEYPGFSHSVPNPLVTFDVMCRVKTTETNRTHQTLSINILTTRGVLTRIDYYVSSFGSPLRDVSHVDEHLTWLGREYSRRDRASYPRHGRRGRFVRGCPTVQNTIIIINDYCISSAFYRPAPLNIKYSTEYLRADNSLLNVFFFFGTTFKPSIPLLTV